jgi:hypothetical protein
MLSPRVRPWLLALALMGALASASITHAQVTRASAALGLATEPAPWVAKYRVTVTRPASGKLRNTPTVHTWYFVRDAQRIALLKGAVDEVWHRDAQNRISFERVFHDDQRVVDYSTGELATLNVQVDWAALSRLVDPAELAQLQWVSSQGQGTMARMRLRGGVGQARVEVDWLPALQLPQRLMRHGKNQPTVHIELLDSAPAATAASAHWPQVGAASAHYLHLDAADFGDMDYEPVVRKSEAMDVRLGWRASHQHD